MSTAGCDGSFKSTHTCIRPWARKEAMVNIPESQGMEGRIEEAGLELSVGQ